MADVTEIPNVKIGDEATIYGEREEISLDTVANANCTINYEIACAVSSRVPRVYTRDQTTIKAIQLADKCD